jgi:hypothetical protein
MYTARHSVITPAPPQPEAQPPSIRFHLMNAQKNCSGSSEPLFRFNWSFPLTLCGAGPDSWCDTGHDEWWQVKMKQLTGSGPNAALKPCQPHRALFQRPFAVEPGLVEGLGGAHWHNHLRPQICCCHRLQPQQKRAFPRKHRAQTCMRDLASWSPTQEPQTPPHIDFRTKRRKLQRSASRSSSTGTPLHWHSDFLQQRASCAPCPPQCRRRLPHRAFFLPH